MSKMNNMCCVSIPFNDRMNATHKSIDDPNGNKYDYTLYLIEQHNGKWTGGGMMIGEGTYDIECDIPISQLKLFKAAVKKSGLQFYNFDK